MITRQLGIRESIYNPIVDNLEIIFGSFLWTLNVVLAVFLIGVFVTVFWPEEK